ncbi:MAG: baseplate J/gp47 family protein [Candidatus Neomarinimicrobiota bacterium]|jgi:hypothetical protein
MPLDEKTTNLAEDITGDAQQLIEQAYLESSGYSLRRGSAIYTMFVSRLADFLQPIFDFIARILGAINLNLSSAYLTFYDIIASVFMDERNIGGKSTGQVIFGFDTSRFVEVENGGIVYTNTGLRYEVVRRYVFTPSQLLLTDGIYYTPPVEVEAVLAGAEYEIKSREITGTLMALPGMVDIYNPNDFTPGSDEETGEEFIERLKDSVSSRTLSSISGIRYLLMKNYSSIIEDIVSIRAGDEEMERDIVYAQTENNGLVFGVVDFDRKVAESKNEERSMAYYNFSDSMEPQINMDLNNHADVEGFNSEFSQEDYNKIGGLDSNLVERSSEIIFSEDWIRAETTSDCDPWFISETNTTGPRKHYADFVSIEGGRLKIGGQAIRENIAMVSRTIQRAVDIMKNFFDNSNYADENDAIIKALDNTVLSYGPMIQKIAPGATTRKIWVPQFTKFSNYIEYVAEQQLIAGSNFGTEVSRTNVSPVIQVPLSRNSGIIIKGDFIIEDADIIKPRSFYITNFRANNSIPKAYDGYGIAIMPDIEPGSPNLFIVDGGALSDDYFIAGGEVHAGAIFENALKSKNLSIDVGVKYNYEMIYGHPEEGSDNAITLDIRIWENGTERPVLSTISYGAYIPMNMRAQALSGEAQTLEATDFGFGLIETDGFSWSVGPVEITQIDMSYAQLLFMMDVSHLAGKDVEVIVGHRGSGSDGGVLANGSRVKIIDFNNIENPVWEDVVDNELGMLALDRKSFSVDRYSDNNDYMFILLTAMYPNNGYNNIPSKIYSDYVALSRNLVGYHVGSKIDLYIKKKVATYDPESEHYIDLMSVSSKVRLSRENGFNVPVIKIENIEILDGDGLQTGVFLEEYYDYRVISDDPSYDGSVKENKLLLLSNYAMIYNLRVTYKYIVGLIDMQLFVDSEDYAGTRTDILIKHPQIKYIDVSFSASYSGSDLEDAIRKYIYSQDTKIEAFKIISLVVEYGAESMSVADIQIIARYYDSYGNLHEEISQDKIEKSRTQIFVPKLISIT